MRSWTRGLWKGSQWNVRRAVLRQVRRRAKQKIEPLFPLTNNAENLEVDGACDERIVDVEGSVLPCISKASGEAAEYNQPGRHAARVELDSIENRDERLADSSDEDPALPSITWLQTRTTGYSGVLNASFSF